MLLARRERAGQGGGKGREERPLAVVAGCLVEALSSREESSDPLLAGQRWLLSPHQAMPIPSLGVAFGWLGAHVSASERTIFPAAQLTASWVSQAPLRALVFLICKMGIIASLS